MPRPVDVVLPPGRRCPPNLDFLAAIDHEAPRACQHWTSHRRDRLCARSRSPSRNRLRLHTGALELFESGAPRPQTTDAAPMRNEQESPRAPSTLPWGFSEPVGVAANFI